MEQESETRDRQRTSTFSSSVVEDLNTEMQLPRRKTSTVWEALLADAEKFKLQEVRDALALVSALPTTQVAVERLFSALKHLTPDHRASMKTDLVNALTLLRMNGF